MTPRSPHCARRNGFGCTFACDRSVLVIHGLQLHWCVIASRRTRPPSSPASTVVELHRQLRWSKRMSTCACWRSLCVCSMRAEYNVRAVGQVR
jgi:hypothetical protein